MKHCLGRPMAAALLATALAGPVLAQTADPMAGPPPNLSPGLLTLGNLNTAGLLYPAFSNDIYATIQTRIGESRSALSASLAPGGPQEGFRDGSLTYVLPVSVLKELPAATGASFLRFSGAYANVDPDDNLQTVPGDALRADVQYFRAPSPDLMYGIGVFYNDADFSETLGRSVVNREAFGVRGDVMAKISDRLGFVGRLEYSLGDQSLSVPLAPGVTLEQEQDDDRLYVQAELVGTYGPEDVPSLPATWVLHPTVGLAYQRNFIEEVQNSLGATVSGILGDEEDYGLAYARLRMESFDPRPGTLSPNGAIGFEYEFANDLNGLVDEDTYAVISVGFGYQMSPVARLEVDYTRHQGLSGNRSSDTLALATNFTF
ncbi:hypothetical protein EU805_08465 [Salipiger sp. IMCC34102]|uniref:hypothetical protein n=1 Tax=Salipiger sp. IMCC34102 TaxID=2510647 RepID=UPI00101E0C0B|nr:hypothetical protein [Salipiger sp. IMCC34102]RYH02647.1 hypothetical protein EU805_08465 [Salipiger sp. IMCC34102]